MFYGGGGVNAQVGIGTTSPNASAVLDLTSTTQGLLPPRMTQAQRDAIASPVAGLMVYQSDGTSGLYYYTGSAWVYIINGTAGSGDMTLAGVQTVTGAKTFGAPSNVGKLVIAGSTSGTTILNANATAGSGTVVLPTTGTLATLAGTETLTNKTLTSAILEGTTVVNETGAATNFRVESDLNDHQFFVDGTNNEIGVSTSTPNSTLDIQGSLGYKVNTITAAATLNQTHNVVLCNTGPYTVTLPAAATNAGKVYYIKSIDAEGDAITIDGNGTETINANLTYSLNNYHHVVRIICDGSNWHIINEANKTVTGTIVSGTISGLTCGSATNNGTLTTGKNASIVTSVIPYTGGNSGSHFGQIVNSTGVTGLTAMLSSGTFASGSGSLTYTIVGKPTSQGTATFALNIGGQTCNLTRTVTCSGSASVGGFNYGIVAGGAGKCWLDRNLGATQIATSSTDANAYGHYYQWGRLADGHQITISTTTTTTQSTTDNPGNALFIVTTNGYVFRSPMNYSLWQGVDGGNNPCPSGFRIPTYAELDAERASWGSNNAAGAFASPLKLPMAGARSASHEGRPAPGAGGMLWASSNTVYTGTVLNFSASSAGGADIFRTDGINVRCIMD